MLIRRILIPTDYSEAAARAVPAAVAMAERFDARMTLIHVAERLIDFVPVAAGIPPVELEAYREADAEAGRRLAEWARERFPADRQPDTVIAEGDAAEEIVAAAESLPAELIVMGRQGHSALERILVGSVAEGVLKSASCPVLVIPARDTATD